VGGIHQEQFLQSIASDLGFIFADMTKSSTLYKKDVKKEKRGEALYTLYNST